MVMQATLASGSGVGPYARLRAGAAIDSGAYIGNFVELKGAHVGHGGNVCHLSYLGDADVGERANIGAGTITCNYSELLYSCGKPILGVLPVLHTAAQPHGKGVILWALSSFAMRAACSTLAYQAT